MHSSNERQSRYRLIIKLWIHRYEKREPSTRGSRYKSGFWYEACVLCVRSAVRTTWCPHAGLRGFVPWGGPRATCDGASTGATSSPTSGSRYYQPASALATGKIRLVFQPTKRLNFSFTCLTWPLVDAFLLAAWDQVLNEAKKQLLPRLRVGRNVRYRPILRVSIIRYRWNTFFFSAAPEVYFCNSHLGNIEVLLKKMLRKSGLAKSTGCLTWRSAHHDSMPQ